MKLTKYLVAKRMKILYKKHLEAKKMLDDEMTTVKEWEDYSALMENIKRELRELSWNYNMFTLKDARRYIEIDLRCRRWIS